MSDPDRVPDLLLERYRLGELTPAEASALERRLAADAETRERLLRIEADDADIRRRQPPGWLAEQVRSRLSASQRASADRARAPRGWAWSAALASAAALVLVVVAREPWSRGLAPGASPGLAPQVVPSAPSAAPTAGASQPAASSRAPGVALPDPSGDRIKGLQAALALFRRTAAGSEALADGARARSGDVVRLGYRAAGRGYGAIVSVDGRGTVTQHLPARGSRAVALQPGPVLLDDAYELDDAPRFERFYLVAAETPFDLVPVLEAARRAAESPELRPLALPRTFEQSTFSLEKKEEAR